MQYPAWEVDLRVRLLFRSSFAFHFGAGNSPGYFVSMVPDDTLYGLSAIMNCAGREKDRRFVPF